MGFCSEWMLQIHRATWFPVHWLLGLERCAKEYPLLNTGERKEDNH